MKTASLLVLLAACGLAAAADVVGPSWYSCDPTTCQPPDCLCPSDSAPGGLTPAETPQFVLLQHSMALEEVSYALMEKIRGSYANPNGCKVPMTWMAMAYHSNCSSAWSAQERGDEIAMQTNRYTPVYPFSQLKVDPNPRYNNSGPDGKASILKEIEMSRDWWNSACKIPFKDMNGFRSPELVHNPPVRQALEKLGFLYDATINEYYASYNPTSPSKNEVVWPFTMDNGIPLDCNFTGVEVAFCNQQERYPGLWEVPLYQMQDPTTGNFLGNADYGTDKAIGPYDVYEVLKENFDVHYDGSRTPLPIALNIKWINESSNAKALEKFIKYAVSKPNTWFITTQDLVYWMQNPKNVNDVGAWLTCTTPGIRNVDPNAPVAPAPAPVEEAMPMPMEEMPDASAPADAMAMGPMMAVPVGAPAPSLDSAPRIVRPVVQQPTTDTAQVGSQSTSGAASSAVGAGAATLAALMAALALML